MFFIEEGHLIIVIFAVLTFISYHYLGRANIKSSLGFLLCAVLTLKIFLSANLYLGLWDEGFHALVAKNIWNHPLKPTLIEYPVLPNLPTNWSLGHVWLHKPPLSSWIMGISIQLFGVNEWAVRIPSMLMHVLIVFFVFKIGQQLFNNEVGWWSAVLYSLSYLPNNVSSGLIHTDHVDTCFVFFIMASIYTGVVAIDRNQLGRIILSGVLMGMAVLSKWLPGLIVMVFIGLYLFTNKNINFVRKCLFIAIMLVVTLLLVMPWQWYIFLKFPVEALTEYNYNLKHFNSVIEGHDNPWWFHIDVAIRNFTIFILIIIPLFIFFGIKDKLGWRIPALVLHVLVVFIFFTMARTKLIGYTAIAYPVLSLIIGYLVVRIGFQTRSIWYKVVVFSFMVLISLQSIDFMKLNDYRPRSKKWCESQKELAKAKFPEHLVIFDDPHYVEAMFYIDRCTAYPFKVDTMVMDSLSRVGYRVLTYDEASETYR